MVNPENILGLLLDARPRPRTNLNESPDVLDFPIERKAVVVDDAFKLLSVLCERSPEVVLAERDRVLDFVRTHALHYVEPVERHNKPDPVYRDVLDYRTRVLALKSLELLAQAADVYTIVDDLMRDPPDNPAPGRPNEITIRGSRLIEQIRALE